MSKPITDPTPIIGWTGFALGTIALLIALIVFVAGPFAPQQSTGVVLGELAVEILQSASRSMAGLAQPEPEAIARDIDDYLNITVSIAAAAAIVFGLAAFIRREPRRLAASSMALGGLVIGFQIFTFTVAMIAGALIIFALISTLAGPFGEIFGG